MKTPSLPSSTATAETLTSFTGLVWSLENSQVIKCLHTGSSIAVVGVKCLEEAYSSLAEGYLQQER
jgi:hypothetical protein